ncbi:DUF4249 domain-containing protein [Rhodocytophaga aerolata]|uniref:DUF4249 domain-containing protein n=1 Tax=Rhodocytophaga aerolata TaxID=455078 RepID=A0ABT8R594_9BACT|nr:DUF4249 domain-containing protein [Rhodocytophaga aerolata]MDO1447255.1 DUF4249 domain-containing protein [Rhodocytophaga aerolata]
MFKSIVYYSWLVWMLSSCINEIELPIRSESPRLVVEGMITNEKPPYIVRLFTTGDFLSSRYPPASLGVQSALVTITDNTGRSTTLKAVLEQPGVYQTVDSTFRGEIGRLYTLAVRMPDGKTFQSQPEQLLPVPVLDELKAKFVDVPDRSQPSGYQVLVDTQDPVETANYYRWSAYGYVRRESEGLPMIGGGICCKSCWLLIANNEVNIFSDANINGNRIQERFALFSPFYVRGKQYVEVSQYSLTREAYQFWKLLDEQQTRTGSLFDPQPAPIEGNIYNVENTNELALGYFGASAVSRRRLIIAGDTVTMFPDYQKAFVPLGPKDCRFAFPNASFFPPENWLR